MAVLRRCAFATVSAILSLGLITLSASAEVPEHTLPDVVAAVLPSVVAVAAFHNDSRTTEPITGSGFIIDRTGLIVTNKHVIDGATMIVVTLNDGTTMSAVLVGTAMLNARGWPFFWRMPSGPRRHPSESRILVAAIVS